MLLLLAKLILPFALASGPRTLVKVPVDVSAFQGSYAVVNCPRAISSNVDVDVDIKGETLVIRDASTVIASFHGLQSDGYGVLSQTLPDRHSGNVTTNTVQLNESELMVDSKVVPFGSFGFGVKEETCLLKRSR